jgi:hypothetical protein
MLPAMKLAALLVVIFMASVVLSFSPTPRPEGGAEKIYHASSLEGVLP